MATLAELGEVQKNLAMKVGRAVRGATPSGRRAAAHQSELYDIAGGQAAARAGAQNKAFRSSRTSAGDPTTGGMLGGKAQKKKAKELADATYAARRVQHTGVGVAGTQAPPPSGFRY